MRGIKKLAFAVAVMSALGLGGAGTAHAAGGNGRSFCSNAGQDVHLGQVFINEVRINSGGFAGDLNPGVLFQGFSGGCQP
jgi:hypothetical protein